MAEKTVYVTDLDGTLLNTKGQLSDKTIEILNDMIEKGLTFSVATARSAATCRVLLKDIKFNTPIVLMNGVFIYDLLEDKYINVERINYSDSLQLMKIFSDYNKFPFMYNLTDDEKGLEVFYRDLENKYHQQFYNDRAGFTYKKFEKISSYPFGENTVYYVFIDEYDKLTDLKEQIEKNDNLKTTFCKDNYSDYWYLEIFSKTASKSNAVEKLKKIVGADKLVCFGDNHNDKEMFSVSDECYAVENAVEELKQSASGIIGTNEDDSVALKIKSMFENQK